MSYFWRALPVLHPWKTFGINTLALWEGTPYSRENCSKCKRFQRFIVGDVSKFFFGISDFWPPLVSFCRSVKFCYSIFQFSSGKEEFIKRRRPWRSRTDWIYENFNLGWKGLLLLPWHHIIRHKLIQIIHFESHSL